MTEPTTTDAVNEIHRAAETVMRVINGMAEERENPSWPPTKDEHETHHTQVMILVDSHSDLLNLASEVRCSRELAAAQTSAR